MSDPVRLTPGALESLLAGLDGDGVASFVADLYGRAGRATEREGNVVTVVTPGGERERVLVWSDDRDRLGRLLGGDPDVPDVDDVDAVVTRRQDDPAAATIAEKAGARLVDAADLHDRLLYAVDREVCRELCREHFDAEVDPRPAPEDSSGGIVPGTLSRRRVLLAAVALCGLFVVAAAGLPGSGLPGDALGPGGPAETLTPVDAGDVTPVGGSGDTSTPTASVTPGTPVTPEDPVTRTPPLPPTGEPDGGGTPVPLELSPCGDRVGSGAPCIALPPRPFDSTHPGTVPVGSSVRINGTFGNPYESNLTRALVGIEVPRGWKIQALSGATFDAVGQGYLPLGELAPGESRNVSWAVTVPESTEGGRYNVTVVSEWEVPGYESPDFPDNASTDPSGDYFRVRKNYTYRVRPAECRGVEPCSLLADDPNGSEPFEPGTVLENATNTTAGYLYNPHNRTITNGTITLDPPNGEWNVTPVDGTTFEALGPGESQTVAWNLTPPAFNYCPGNYTIQGTATYELDGGNRVTVPFSFDVVVRNTGVCMV